MPGKSWRGAGRSSTPGCAAPWPSSRRRYGTSPATTSAGGTPGESRSAVTPERRSARRSCCSARRHRPTAWAVFGISDAILAGDALLALASECLAECALASRAGGVQLLSRCVAERCHGQSLDLSFEQRDGIEMGECWTMVAAKTGALLGCGCSLGALAGGGDARQAQLFSEFGRHFGRAFQLVDDLLGIWGNPKATGKPVYSDLISRKKSLPVAAALNSGTAPGQELASLYRRGQPFGPGELAHAADLVERTGAREWARRSVTDEITTATEFLTAADCRPEAAAALGELARLLIQRDH